MPEIDLRPDSYKFRGKDGRWYRRDDPRFLAGGLAVSVVVLGLIYFWRTAFASDLGVLFGLVAVFASCAGIFLGLLLKDVY